MFAYKEIDNVTRFSPDGTNFLQFTSEWDSDYDPVAPMNVNASITNLFYLINTMHDLTYEYGFNEAAGNFQMDNFGKGGKEGDAIEAFIHDPAGFNNAAFFTPPDGQSGLMAMSIFNSNYCC